MVLRALYIHEEGTDLEKRNTGNRDIYPNIRDTRVSARVVTHRVLGIKDNYKTVQSISDLDDGYLRGQHTPLDLAQSVRSELPD